MSAPKHLWSGDWEQDSADAAAERAAARGRLGSPAAAPHEPDPSAPRPRPDERASRRSGLPAFALAVLARIVAVLRALGGIVRSALSALRHGRRPSSTALLLGSALFFVIVAVALAIRLTDNGSSSAASGSGPYLGIVTESVPINRVLITAVVPGSPADRAGLGPGDVLLQVQGQPVRYPGDVGAILGHLHAGDQVQIQFEQGPNVLSTEATLTSQPGP